MAWHIRELIFFLTQRASLVASFVYIPSRNHALHILSGVNDVKELIVCRVDHLTTNRVVIIVVIDGGLLILTRVELASSEYVGMVGSLDLLLCYPFGSVPHQ